MFPEKCEQLLHLCVCVSAAMEGDGEVIISPVQNCSHCESGECHESKDGIVCYCDEDLVLASDGVSCLNVSGWTCHFGVVFLCHAGSELNQAEVWKSESNYYD